MDKIESFTYKSKSYPKGTVIIRNKGGSETKEIFMWHYPSNDRYLVITTDDSYLPGHLPRSIPLAKQFFEGIVRIESPTNSDLQKVKELEKDFALQRRSSSGDSLGPFLLIFALVVGSMLFPPLAIILLIYAFSRQK